MRILTRGERRLDWRIEGAQGSRWGPSGTSFRLELWALAYSKSTAVNEADVWNSHPLLKLSKGSLASWENESGS